MSECDWNSDVCSSDLPFTASSVNIHFNHTDISIKTRNVSHSNINSAVMKMTTCTCITSTVCRPHATYLHYL